MKKYIMTSAIILTFIFGVAPVWAAIQNVPVHTQSKEQAADDQADAFSAWQQPDSEEAGADWDPYKEMENMRKSMNKLFQNSMLRANRIFSGAEQPFANPRLDMKEEAGQYIVRIDVPGMEKDKIDIKATDDSLTISGERKIESENSDPKSGYVQMERSYGKFERIIPMPANVDTGKISAKYDAGVLTLTLAKKNPAQEDASVKKIQVQ